MQKWLWLILVCLGLTAEPAYCGQDDRSQWAPSVTFMTGKLDSQDLSDLFSEIFGYEVDFTGRSWDIGATRGRPGHSYLRLSYVQLRIDDGSRAFDYNTDYYTNSVQIKGFKAERLWRLGPSKWVVAPMFALHGGIGKIGGTVTKIRKLYYFDPFDGTTEILLLPPEERTASEAFGDRNWLPILGAGVGLTASIADRATITVSVYGLEFPGTYKGQVQFVYWPK